MLRWCLGYRRAGEATLSNYELYGHLPSARSIVTEVQFSSVWRVSPV
jgi:hypothetical protein